MSYQHSFTPFEDAPDPEDERPDDMEDSCLDDCEPREWEDQCEPPEFFGGE
jgi:hypothetical protein